MKKKGKQTLPPALIPLTKSVTHGCFRWTLPPHSRGLLCKPWVIATPTLIGLDTMARDALLAPQALARLFGLPLSRGACDAFGVAEKDVPISFTPRRSCTAESIAALAVPVTGSSVPKLRSYVHGRNLIPWSAHVHLYPSGGCYWPLTSQSNGGLERLFLLAPLRPTY